MRVSAGEADDRLGSVALAVVDKFVAGRLAEGVVDPGVQVRQRAEDVFLRQTCGDRLRHDADCTCPESARQTMHGR